MPSDHRKLFGTSGIRGPADTLFTNDFCFDIGRSFSKFLEKYRLMGPVAVGMDPRGSSPRIKESFERGLAYEKREIFDQGATPVPSLCYLLHTSDFYQGSAMITGSHIKDFLNGIKFFAFKNEITKRHEKEIEDIYYKIRDNAEASTNKFEVHNETRANDSYKEMLRGIAKPPYPNWRVVVDPGDGAQSDTMPVILKELGLKVCEVNSTIQGQFFARDTENEEDFNTLKREVVRKSADFGIGYDSDGDRVIFVDKLGNFIPGDYTASIIAKENRSSVIVTPISTSQVVDKIGKKVVRTKVGSPYVIEKMQSTGATFGFEANGGGIFSEIMFTRDGGSTTINFLNILKSKKKTLEECISELPKYFLFRTKVDYKWEMKDEIIKRAMESIPSEKTEDLDGLKLWVDSDTWILFRSSSNAPEFRIFTESSSREKANALMEKGAKLVREVVEG